jgi:hypothetical protein
MAIYLVVLSSPSSQQVKDSFQFSVFSFQPAAKPLLLKTENCFLPELKGMVRRVTGAVKISSTFARRAG